MKSYITIGLALIFLVAGSTSCSLSRSYTLEGYVYESYSKTPLPGVTIQSNNFSATSDRDGFFRIKGLSDKKVPILVGKNKNFTDLTDILLFDQKINHRDFILEAKHPLDIDLTSYREPSSFVFSYLTVSDKKTPKTIFSGRSVPIDESLDLVGKFIDQTNSWKKIEIIQIGLSFFEKDEYDNWNETTQPNIQALQFQSNVGDLIKKAYHFFEDPTLSYKEVPGIVTIEGMQTVLYEVKEVNSKENSQQYGIYVVKDGKSKGQIKKVTRSTSSKNLSSSQPEVSFILSQWNEMLEILAPQITQ